MEEKDACLDLDFKKPATGEMEDKMKKAAEDEAAAKMEAACRGREG